MKKKSQLRINKFALFDKNEYKFLAAVRQNAVLEIYNVSVLQHQTYKLVKRIKLEQNNQKQQQEQQQQQQQPNSNDALTEFVSLGIHNDEFLYTVDEAGHFYLIFLDDLTNSIKEEDLKEESEDEDDKEEEEEQEKEQEQVTNEAQAQPEKPKTETITQHIPELEFETNIQVLSFQLKAPISALVDNSAKFGIFAYGGKENDLKIIDISKSLQTYKDTKKTTSSLETIFLGKNVKHDRLDLRVPIWISNIAFINNNNDDQSSLSLEEKPKFELITTTHFGEIRTYDTAHGRKPTSNQKVLDPKSKILQLAHVPAIQQQVIISDDHTSVIKYDFQQKRQLGKYHGNQGAILALHSTASEKHSQGIVVSGGLDRYVRAFDIATRSQIAKVFTNSRISGVWYIDEGSLLTNKRSLEDVSDQESENDEDLWDQLEQNEQEEKTTVSKQNGKKKRKL